MKIFVSSQVPADIQKALESQGDELTIHNSNIPLSKEALMDQIAEAEVLVCPLSDHIDAEVMDAGNKLKLIANYGAGYDNIDIAYAKEKGILVTNAPAPSSAVSTTELTFGMILALARKFFPGYRDLQAGNFKAWRPTYMLGQEVRGKTLGILGMGNIGQALAKRALAFEMKVIYHSRSRKEEAEAMGAVWKRKDDLLREADIVSLHTAYHPDLHHMIAEEELAMMKASAYLINAARGPLVKEAALLQALKDGSIAGAALDVFEFEPDLSPAFFDMDQVVVLPHLGNATVEARLEMGQAVLDNLEAYRRGETPPYHVNP